LYAQELKAEFDKAYNMDPELYNGKVFTGVYRGKVDGNQFFESFVFLKGDLALNNATYPLQSLNYDVFEQKILLSFIDAIKATKIIELPLANVRYFYLEEKYFEVHLWGESKYRIFQSIANDEVSILINWTKTLNAGTGAQNNRSRFSKLKKRIWVLMEEDYHPIKNNKTFGALFSIEKQDLLKKWLKETRIKIQKADDAQLLMIIEYLDSI
jgi:hypothetical protein